MTLPAMPDPHAIAVLLLTVVALFLFSRDYISLESSSLFILVVLVVGFELFPYTGDVGQRVTPVDFFLGFGHEALIAVCALMIVGQSLVRTGALEPVARTLARLWRVRPTISFVLTMIIAAALSAFVNNTPIVVLLLPILINVSLRTKSSTSATLMPVGFVTILGGMCTTIGTSTNLLVVAVAADMGMTRFSMFDFSVLAMMAGTVGLLYLWFVAPRLVPERKPPLADTTPRIFSAQIRIPEHSYGDGRRLGDLVNKTGEEMRVQRVQRGEELFLTPLPELVIQAGDTLLVNDSPEQLREYEKAIGGELWSGDHQVDEAHPLSAENQQIAEVVVMAGSRLQGMRLGDARLASKYKLTLLAVHRAGKVSRERRPGSLQDTVLDAGDVLLVQGTREDVAKVKEKGELLVLDGGADLPRTRKAPLALVIMVAVVTIAAAGIMPISISAVAGVMLLIATRCIQWRDIQRALSTQVILIIVASLALGSAMMRTGAADFVAQVFVGSTFGLPAGFVIAALILMIGLLTNVVSNNAAAVIGTPIAISIAQRLGLPLEPFVLAVLFGANMSFATPMAYQTNLLVMNAGGYKFGDFVRVGVPLALIMWIVYSILLTWAYQL